MKIDIDQLKEELKGLSADEVVGEVIKKFGPLKTGLASSLSLEDQVLTHMVALEDKTVKVFTLDTGRLFQETYDTIQATREKLGITVKAYFPEAKDVEEMENGYGPNLMYESTKNRKLCCSIRKLKPLARALEGLEAWICGLRREHSPERGDVDVVEWDEANGLVKINPLASWSTEKVKQYIEENKIPYNKLQDKGFVSLGCAPCTREVLQGEDFRAGRWWWESNVKRECGLHNRPKK